MALPETIEKLIKRFSEFPGIGSKQAARFVFFLLNAKAQYRADMLKELRALETIAPCASCNLPSMRELCPICANDTRAHNQICVVEKISDLLSLEKSQAYRGTYYILGASIQSEKAINLGPLRQRLGALQKKHDAIEIILATNPTTEGEASALFLEKELRAPHITITRLGRGLPMGAELEYADAATLHNALDNRKRV